MIKNIHLQNFQIHKDSHLEFHPNINIITGSSDQGKSSIIKALHWLCFNKPSGTEFINKRSKECSVKAEFDNGTVERIRSDKRNEYIVNGETLKAMKSSLPEEVSAVTQITSTNIQSQFYNEHFLIDKSPGEVAQSLNSISGLQDIDQTLYNINSKIKEVSKEMSRHESNINQIQQDISEFDHLEELDNELSEIEELNEEVESLSEKFEEIRKITKSTRSKMERSHELSEKIEIVNNHIVDIENDLVEIDGLRNDLRSLEKIYKSLSDLYNKSDKKQIEVKNLENKLDELLEDVDICPFCGGEINDKEQMKCCNT